MSFFFFFLTVLRQVSFPIEITYDEKKFSFHVHRWDVDPFVPSSGGMTGMTGMSNPMDLFFEPTSPDLVPFQSKQWSCCSRHAMYYTSCSQKDARKLV